MDADAAEELYDRIEDELPEFPEIDDKFEFIFKLKQRVGGFGLRGSVTNKGTQRAILALWDEHQRRQFKTRVDRIRQTTF